MVFNGGRRVRREGRSPSLPPRALSCAVFVLATRGAGMDIVVSPKRQKDAGVGSESRVVVEDDAQTHARTQAYIDVHAPYEKEGNGHRRSTLARTERSRVAAPVYTDTPPKR